MPGDRWQKFANLRALYGWMWAHPGKKLLFIGGEIGMWREWDETRELDWFLLDQPDHEGVRRLVADLNRAYTEHPALWQRDHSADGFEWIDANNADANSFSFVRRGDDGQPVVCVANLSPVPLYDVRLGLPQPGPWREILNTDSEIYGGSNVGNLGVIHASDFASHGQPASAELTIPPLGVVWLVPGEG